MIIDQIGADLFHADGRTGGQTHDTQTDIHNESNSLFFAVLRRRLKTTLRPELRLTAPKTVSVTYEAGYICKCFGRY